ncbi:MAG TPA: hypothetical protein PK295_01705 [Candidatus Magasanikbacteria bacterium]|nr:hypothetical protein [Candidatus Magasanikbacteria bacterium]
MNKSFTIKIISWLLPCLVLLTILLFPDLFVALLASVAWFGYVAYVGIVYRSQVYELLAQVFTMFSFLWLLFLVESVVLRWFLIAVSVPIFFFLIWMSSELTGRLVHIQEKPLRRMRMMIHVFNMYAGCLALFAINIFFPGIPFIVVAVVGGIYAAIISLLIWKLYFKVPIREFTLPLLVVGLGVTELIWALHLMPFGYLAQGLLVVWIWYVLQLLIRFHRSPRGIIWKEQLVFLCTNALLFTGVLVFIRWV